MLLIIILLTFNSYKQDYIATQLPINQAQALDLYNDEDDLNIYIEEEEEELDELSLYLQERS